MITEIAVLRAHTEGHTGARTNRSYDLTDARRPIGGLLILAHSDARHFDRSGFYFNVALDRGTITVLRDFALVSPHPGGREERFSPKSEHSRLMARQFCFWIVRCGCPRLRPLPSVRACPPPTLTGST